MTRASSTRLLTWVAAICFVFANLGVWAHQVVYDRLGFRETARAIFDKPEVQQRIATQAVNVLAGAAEDRKPLGTALERRLTQELADALGSPALVPIVNGVLDFSWRVVVDREPEDVVLELTRLRAISLSIAEAEAPELAARIRELPKPLKITVLKADDVPSVAPYRAPVEGFVWVICALALLAALLAVRFADDVPQALRRMALAIGLPAGALALLALLVPSLVGDQLIVEVATRVLMARLVAQCAGLMAMAFLLYWLGKAAGWLREIDQRLRRIEERLLADSMGPH